MDGRAGVVDRSTDGSITSPHLSLPTSNNPVCPRQILAANEKDLANARDSRLAGPLLDRLALSEAKLKTLADGISALADVSPTAAWFSSSLSVFFFIDPSFLSLVPYLAFRRWTSPSAGSSRAWSSPPGWS